MNQEADMPHPQDVAVPSLPDGLLAESQAHNAKLEAQVKRLRELIADDAYAMTFQTFGQYRTALLAALKP